MFKNGKIKYVDFGLATKYHQGNLMKTFAGSPLNMAPQVLKGAHYDDKVDIYSLGTVLFEMLQGTQPFRGRNIQQLIENIHEKRYSKPLKTENSLRKKLQDIMIKMLEADPQKRLNINELINFGQNLDRDYFQKQLTEIKNILRQPIINQCTFIFGGMAGPLSKLWLSHNSEIKQFEKRIENEKYRMANNLSFVRQNQYSIFDNQNYSQQKIPNKIASQLDLRISCRLFVKHLQKNKLNHKNQNKLLNNFEQIQEKNSNKYPEQPNDKHIIC